MYISSENNNYPFSNAVIKVTDNTVIVPKDAPQRAKPRFNYLFPIKTAKGPTNTVVQFYPGEAQKYVDTFGAPSYAKNGLSSEMIHQILSMSKSGMGVYAVNLKDPSATRPFYILKATVKEETGVAKKNLEGQPLYLTSDGREVTIAEGNTPITITEVTIAYGKYEAPQVTDDGEIGPHDPRCRTEQDVFALMEAGFKETVEGKVKTTVYPLMAFYYDGCGTYANDFTMNISTLKTEYASSIYYKLNTHDYNDGSVVSYSANTSFFPDSEQFFICNAINSMVPNVSSIPSNHIESYFEYLKMHITSSKLKGLDIFDLTGIVVAATGKDDIVFKMDPVTLDIGTPDAIRLSGGLDVVPTTATEKPFDELVVSLLKDEIIRDLSSILRYRIKEIIDIGYSDTVKQAIVEFCNKRIRTTIANLIVGSNTNLSSAVIDANENYVGKSQTVRLLAACQSAMAISPYTRRMNSYPPTYFDMLGFINKAITNGNIYQPYAGAKARWTGYKESSMYYPGESAPQATELTKARINVVRKDSDPGAYLSDQMLCTANTSDLTEYNNAHILSDMIYDVVDLIHQNNWTFNEPADVKAFKEKVDENINTLYAAYSASLAVEVYREGETGVEARTNIIEISVDFKDIGKFAKVEFIINDN